LAPAFIETNNILNVTGSSSAGRAVIISAGGQINFLDSSSGGDAIIGSVGGGIIDISQLTTAGMTIGSLVNLILPFNLGSKQLTVGGNDFSFTAEPNFTGTGSVVKIGTGTFTLGGTNTHTGGTTVLGGALVLTGSLASGVTVGPAGLLGGGGTIGGSVVNGGTVAPSNNSGPAIGALTVAGSYTQSAGSTYQVDVTPTKADRITIGGSAALGGAMVSVLAGPGLYAPNTTYTILSAAGGVTGTYAGVSVTNNAFLVPSLSYDADTVFLTLNLNFARGAQTPNQAAVAGALDAAYGSGLSGDLAAVTLALSGLTAAQGAQALAALGGQTYASFGSVSVQGGQSFMNAFTQQAGGGQGGGQVALAEACDVACDATSGRWGAWGGGLGAFGTVAGNANSPGLTYNLGGFAAGLDYRFTPNFVAGVTAGYNAATLYPQGAPGQGTVGTVQFGLYGEYTAGPAYVDALAGYARSDNRMMRQIIIPGLNLRTAWGQTHADQVFGQLEAGYKLTVAPSFGGFVTPFARLQASTSTQAGFTETGADSLNLVVASQTTNSLRTVLGAQLGASIDAGWRDKLDLTFRLGWSHEHADLNRPVGAAFAGAPAFTFTTQGAVAPRDGVILGLGAKTAIADATSLYLRYDGDLAGANTNHILSAGVRMTW
jgi:autotransporter-associated beta strand protein